MINQCHYMFYIGSYLLGPYAYYNINEPQKYYAKQKKHKTKTIHYIIKFVWDIQKRQIYRDRK